MDSKSSIINEIKKYVPFMNEEFLASVTNKGIYKRSVKDLEKIKSEINLTLTENNELELKLDEETKVVLNLNVQSSTCTCPSQNLCKHIIISMIYLKDYYENNPQEDTKQEVISCEGKNNEYEELNSLTQEKVLDIVGKKDFNSLVNSIIMKNEAVFEYGELLTVQLQNQNVKVYFPKEKSIENAICSCKEKKFCKHKSYALLSYLINELNMNFVPEDSIVEIGTVEVDFLEKLKEYISLLFDTGLSSLTDVEIKKIEKLYIQSYGMKFFGIAAELKNLSSELNFYFLKNVSFSNKRTLHILCGIYNRAEGILKAGNDIKRKGILIGKRKEESFNLDNINIIGLGCTCRISKRNDLIINAYFYCKELKSIMIMSTLRPIENNSINYEYLYNANIVWSDELSFERVSTCKMLLRDAKITTGRISNTKSTICNIKGETKIDDIQDIIISDYSVLREKIRSKSFEYFEAYSESDTIFIIKVGQMKNIYFDKVTQKLKFNVLDVSDNNIEFEIKYSSASELAIKYIEKNKEKNIFEYILGSISERNNELKGIFVSGFYNEKIKNIFFKVK